MIPIPYRVKAERPLAVLDAELVSKVAKSRDWPALRLLFQRWLDPTPTPRMLDEMPFEQSAALGAQLMELITDKATAASSQVDLLNRPVNKRPF